MSASQIIKTMAFEMGQAQARDWMPRSFEPSEMPVFRRPAPVSMVHEGALKAQAVEDATTIEHLIRELRTVRAENRMLIEAANLGTSFVQAIKAKAIQEEAK